MLSIWVGFDVVEFPYAWSRPTIRTHTCYTLASLELYFHCTDRMATSVDAKEELKTAMVELG